MVNSAHFTSPPIKDAAAAVGEVLVNLDISAIGCRLHDFNYK